MSQEKNLKVIEQKTVLFYEDELIAVRGSDDNIYVSLRHLCAALELNVAGQMQRVQRNTVLQQGHRVGNIQTTGGRREVALMRVDLVPLWLAGISTRAIRNDEIRQRLERYQAEAAKVLWEAFQSGRLTMQADFAELLAEETPAVQAYRMIMAMAEMARNQIMIEARIHAQDNRLNVHDDRLDVHEQRLEEIEAALGDPKHQITPSQAMQISQAVKAIALEMSKQSGRNEYGGVYGELYRRFEITSYKLLPAAKFEEAMEWLREWHGAVAGSAPF